MADRKGLITTILGSLDRDINDKGLQKRPEVANYVISSESMDSSAKESAVNAINSLDAIVEETIATIVSHEDYEGVQFSDAQISAAKKIAGLALNPSAARDALSSLKPVDGGAGAVQVSPTSLGVEDIIDPLTLGTEAYDGQAINNALYYSITYNLMAATQDKFGETFFPTITIDPMVSGASIESEYISLYDEFSRSITGSPDGDKFNRIPIVKAIYDNEIFSVDRNKVVPVLRPENASLMVSALQFVDKSTAEEITTAPIVFNKKYSLLGISQTDAQLAKGVMDNTDSLDRRVALQKVYYSLTGDVGNGPVTEYFAFDASVLPHSNFTYSTQDHNKDISLSFNTRTVFLNTSTSTTADGSASSILSSLPANHTVVLEVVLHGDGNTQKGDIVVYGNAIEIVEIRDAAGNVLPTTSSDYTAISTALDGNLALAGYTLEAYRTNSNLRTRGQLITSNRYVQIYVVPLRSGITVLSPVNNASGTDNDASRINSQITVAGIRTSVTAVKTLVEYADTLRQATANGTINDLATMGVGRHLINTYYGEVDLNVANYVDSIKSGDRLADIRAVLVNNIKNQALAMGIESNYFIAHDVMRGNVGGKYNVIVGTDPVIAQFVTGGDDSIDLGDNIVARVVSTPNKLMKNRIIIGFGIFDADRNTKPNPLNFGQMFWSPTITTDVVRTVDGSTSRELTTMPRYLHVVNTPALSVMHVSGLTESLGKVAVNTRTI